MRRALPITLAALAVSVLGAHARAGGGGGGGGKAVRVEASAQRQVFVPAGAFQMGLTDAEKTAVLSECTKFFEIPHSSLVCSLYASELDHMDAHQVFVSAFWIDRDEVSVADYRACVAGGGCTIDALISGNAQYLVPQWPMVNVTWAEAQAFCRWRRGALPTEAQWERAARGDTGSTWPWGNQERPGDFNHGQPRSDLERSLDRGENLDALAGNSDASDGAETLAPVGSYRWSDGPYGTRDQAGNAAEWTADAYLPHALPPRDEPLGYDGLGVVDPVRVGSIGDLRVVRGGSWRQPTVIARTNVRDPFQQWIAPDRRSAYVGFRCARTP